MTNAAIYCRISSDPEHDRKGVGRQREDCEALAERLGWTVAGVYEDDDKSAFSGRARPAYTRLLHDIEAGTIKGLVIWHPDRLHRSNKELEGFIDLIERHRVKIRSVMAGDVDLTTADGRMQARITGTVARHESEHKSERIRRKMDQLVAEKRPHLGGGRAFGTRRVTDADGRPALEIVPAEAELIRKAANAILAGASVRSVVADWQARGVRTVTGKAWLIDTLSTMLTSPRLAGLRERYVDEEPEQPGSGPRGAKARDDHNGSLVLLPTNAPAILERRTWERLRAILRSPDRHTPAYARRNLLVGFAYCGRCGKRLGVRKRTDGVKRYVCLSRAEGGCNGLAIKAAETEAEVTARVLDALDSPTMRQALAEPVSDGPTDAQDEHAEAQARLDELAADYAAGALTRGEWQAARAVLVGRLAAAPVTRPTPRLPADVREVWPTLDLETKRQIIGEVVEKVTIGPAVRGRQVFDPERLTITWTDAVSMRPA